MVEFSLIGGPLQRLHRLLRPAARGPQRTWLGLAIGAGLWAIAFGINWAEGSPVSLLSLHVLGVHVRLLVAVPLFFVCESWIASRPAEVLGGLVRSQVVPVAAAPALQAELARLTRWRESVLPELVCAVAAVLFSLLSARIEWFGATAVPDLSAARGSSVAGRFYWLVCLPAFRFLLFRWLWRLVLWAWLLWRLSRLPLALVPTHPDGVAGLGTLELVHLALAPLVFAGSAVQAASFAEELTLGTMPLEAVYPALALILTIDALVFVGPLGFFAPALFRARANGLLRYMPFASRYVSAFDRKWIGGEAGAESPLGTPDLQSLADLGTSVQIVKDLRLTPISRRLLVALGAAAILPMVPLALLAQPAGALAQRLFERLLGL